MKNFVVVVLFLISLSAISQENVGDRAGVVFYPTIDRNEKTYDISVDLFELGNTKYIEAELYDDNEVKLTSKLFKLAYKDKKYFLNREADGETPQGPEREVFIYDIAFKLKNPDGSLAYMKLKIKILDEDYRVTDFSQKIFY